MKRHSRDAPQKFRSETDKYLDSYYGGLVRHTQLFGRHGRKIIKKGPTREEQVKYLYHLEVMKSMISRSEPLSSEDKRSIFLSLSKQVKVPGGRK